MAMSDLASSFLTLFILFAIFILAYCAITKQKLSDLLRDLKDLIINKKEEVIKK